MAEHDPNAWSNLMKSVLRESSATGEQFKDAMFGKPEGKVDTTPIEKVLSTADLPDGWKFKAEILERGYPGFDEYLAGEKYGATKYIPDDVFDAAVRVQKGKTISKYPQEAPAEVAASAENPEFGSW